MKDIRTPEEELNFRIAHPLCVFCENSYYSFFRVVCKKDPIHRNCKALGCKDYRPTLISIEERSPKT